MPDPARRSLGNGAWPALLVLLLLLPACRATRAGPPEVAVEVGYVAVDPKSETPVLVLREIGGGRLLPIWIGFAEARSIAAQLDRVEPPRPGTHDLAKRVIDGLAGRVDRVVVTELSGGVYYALLTIRTPNGIVELDARPSDAIAIALRTGSPVFVREALFESKEGGRDGDDGSGLGI